jgi:hypothetical protein
MKKITLSLIALAAISSAAFAERSYDLRDSAEARGTIGEYSDHAMNVNALSATDDGKTIRYFGKYGFTNDQMELRRWDEKNGG